MTTTTKKITVEQLQRFIKKIIKEQMEEISLPAIAKGLQVIKTGEKPIVDPDEIGMDGEEREPSTIDGYNDVFYDILDKQGNVVGKLELDEFFGRVTGHLFGRPLHGDISKYGPGAGGALHGFLKSEKGQGWLRALEKQKKYGHKFDF